MEKSAMVDTSQLNSVVEKIYPGAVKIRRRLHRHPELSGMEFKTAALVARELKKYGITPSLYLHKTAVIGRLRNGYGKTIVLRADLDALPIGEKTGLSFASHQKGVMHACGHDLHTAVLLGAAQALAELKRAWQGTVIFLFQPSEEQEPGGAAVLIKAGAFPGKCDAVFGLHVNPDHQTGHIGIRRGIDFAGVTGLHVKVSGVGGHSAAPEKALNPIPVAAEMIGSLRNLNSLCSLVTVGVVHAGTRANIIPDIAEFHGTIRTHVKSDLEAIICRIKKTLLSIAKNTGSAVSIEFEPSYPPGVNDRFLAQKMQAAYASFLGPSKVDIRPLPTMYAEDFAYYQELVPGLFVHLGVRSPQTRVMPNIHSPEFSPDEKAIKTGIIAHTLFGLEILKK